MNNYINPSFNDATRLNNILYYTYCFNVETNEWIFPFTAGTTCYYDVDMLPWIVMPLLESAATDPQLSQVDRDFISAILATQKTEAEAVAAGWLPPPTDN